MTLEKEPEETPEGQGLSGLDDLNAQLEEAARERDQFRGMAQRTQADLVNYRRRVEEERAELQRSASAGLIMKLLLVMDDFQRALSHLPDEDVDAQWLEGVQLIMHKLDVILESEGVSRIEALGKEFDPFEHEALFYEESQDHEGGTVVTVIRDGYKLYDRVLRPAQVGVSKPKSQEESHTGDETEHLENSDNEEEA